MKRSTSGQSIIALQIRGSVLQRWLVWAASRIGWLSMVDGRLLEEYFSHSKSERSIRIEEDVIRAKLRVRASSMLGPVRLLNYLILCLLVGINLYVFFPHLGLHWGNGWELMIITAILGGILLSNLIALKLQHVPSLSSSLILLISFLSSIVVFGGIYAAGVEQYCADASCSPRLLEGLYYSIVTFSDPTGVSYLDTAGPFARSVAAIEALLFFVYLSIGMGVIVDRVVAHVGARNRADELQEERKTRKVEGSRKP